MYSFREREFVEATNFHRDLIMHVSSCIFFQSTKELGVGNGGSANLLPFSGLSLTVSMVSFRKPSIPDCYWLACKTCRGNLFLAKL